MVSMTRASLFVLIWSTYLLTPCEAHASSTTARAEQAARQVITELSSRFKVLPAGIELIRTYVAGSRATVVLSAEAEKMAGNEAAHDRLVHDLVIALDPLGIKHLHIQVQRRDGQVVELDGLMRIPEIKRPVSKDPHVLKKTRLELLDLQHDAGPSAFPFEGALSGFTVVLSPGHGYYWHSSLGWTTQRGEVNGLIEDIHNNEIVMSFLAPALERAGARVITCRDRTRQSEEILVDDGDGQPAYTETGSWNTGAYSGFIGDTYRVSATSADGGSTATWHLAVVKPGRYPVWVAYKAGTNRVSDAPYTVHHAGGSTTVLVDQTNDDLTWVYIGDYWFEPGRDNKVVLENRSGQIGYVIADSVRIGGGNGVIQRGGSTSGKPKWQEAARYWTQFCGAPQSVYDARSDDHSDDIVARPLFADWRGGHVYFSHHTNAGGGTGTSTFIHDTNPSPGSKELQQAVHTKVIRDLRALWKSDWYDRGMKSANFGEVREVRSMPAMLIESAFHDNPDDAEYIHDPRWRRDLARAIAKGIQDYLAPGTPYPPLTPTHVRVTDLGGGRVSIQWKAPVDPLEPSAGARGYRIYASDNGQGFDNGTLFSTETSKVIGGLAEGKVVYFRVSAYNDGGESAPSPVVAVRPAAAPDTPKILIVDGFDRLDRYVREYDNTFDFVREHAEALAASGAYFDSSSNEAVREGLVDLSRYLAVDWFLGEESTRDHTFDPQERAIVKAYLESGKGIVISGSEIAWDLDYKGDGDSRDFINDTLYTGYVSDDAGTYSIRGVTGTVLEGLSFSIDDGTHARYDVQYPDELSPLGPAEKCLAYQDPTGPGAAVLYEGTDYRVAVLGFPFETVIGADQRASLMMRLLSVVAPGYDEIPDREEPHELVTEEDAWIETGHEADASADYDTAEEPLTSEQDRFDRLRDGPGDADTDTDTDVDTDVDVDVDTDADVDTDVDTDTGTGTTSPCDCPECDEGCGCSSRSAAGPCNHGIVWLLVFLAPIVTRKRDRTTWRP